MPTIQDRITTLVSEQLGIQKTDVDFGKTFEGHGADSLDTVELVMAAEDTFGLEIPNAEAEQINTPAALQAYLIARGIPA